jgi:hypothetical protein
LSNLLKVKTHIWHNSCDMKERTLFTIIFALIILVYVTGLFPETTADSAKYASVSREILENGDALHLKIQGEPYLQKPPLLFWLAAISFKLFGVSMFSFKLSTLLFSILGVYSVYRLGRLYFGNNVGLVSALIYATSEALILYNMDVHTDMLLTSNIIFGTWQLVEYLNSRRKVNFIFGFIGIGLAMLSKGVIGLAIPVFGIGGYLLLQKDFKTIFSFRWIIGALIILIIISPALKGLHDQFGAEGLKFFFWSNNIDRIQGHYTNFRHDYSYFIHTFLYLFLPWSFYSIYAFVRDLKDWRSNGISTKGLKNGLNYSAFIPLAIIVSISSQQSPHYLLPIIPFISIITGRYIYKISEEGINTSSFRLAMFTRGFIVVVIWILIGALMLLFFPTKNLLIWGTLLLMAILLIISFNSKMSGIFKLLAPLIITILALGFVTNTNYMPSALKYHGAIQASYKYDSLATEDEILYTYDYPHYETCFYPKRASERIYDEQIHTMFNNGPAWIITRQWGYDTIINSYNDRVVERYEFPFKKLTNISFKFLYPDTREEVLETIYLLKTN